MSCSDPTRVKSNYIPHILRYYGKSSAARDNVNQKPSFVVSAKSMFQLVSTGDIIERVQVIDLSVWYYNYKITMLKTVLAGCFYANV